MKRRLIKNDKSTTDLATELTGLCDQHKLIATTGAFTLFKCHMRYGKLHKTTKDIRGFIISSSNQIFLFELQEECKGLAEEFCSYVVFYPSLRKSPITNYAADNQHGPTSHPDLFWEYHFLELKDWIVQLQLKPPNDCS